MLLIWLIADSVWAAIGACLGERADIYLTITQSAAGVLVSIITLGLLGGKLGHWEADLILRLKHKAWDELPEVGSGDPVALQKFITLAHVCKILGIDEVKKQ